MKRGLIDQTEKEGILIYCKSKLRFLEEFKGDLRDRISVLR